MTKMILRFLVAIILVFSPVLYLIRFSVFSIPTTVLELLIYVLTVDCLLLTIVRKTRWYLPERTWLWPIGLFVAGAIIGVFVSPDKRVALGQFKGFIVDPILFGWVMYSGIRAKLVERNAVVYALLAGGVLLSLGAYVLPVYPVGRALSIYYFDVNPSPNFLALYLAPLVALATGYVISSVGEKALLKISKSKFQISNKFQNPNSKVFYIVASILMMIGLVLSESRGGLLGAFLGVVVAIVLTLNNKLIKTLLALFTLLTLFASLWLARPDLSASPDSGRVASSSNIRYEVWKTTKEIVTESPRNFIFGIGLGNYQDYFTQLTKNRVNYPEFIAPKALTPHNIFLAMWVNGGLLLLVGFVWILVIYFKTLLNTKGENPNDQIPALPAGRQMTNKAQNPIESLKLGIDLKLGFRNLKFTKIDNDKNIINYQLPLIAAMVALLIHGLVDTPYFKNDLSVEFWVLIVLSMSIRNGSMANSRTQ